MPQLPAAWVAFVLVAILVGACSSASESDARSPLALYRDEPNGDDAALVGTLAVDVDGCLVVRDPQGSAMLVAVPIAASSWGKRGKILSIGGKKLPIGEAVVLGGSAHPTDRLGHGEPPMESSAHGIMHDPLPADLVGERRRAPAL